MKTVSTQPSAHTITRNAGTNFYYSFLLLSHERRQAIETIYAYCRLIDDIVDDKSVDNPRGELAKWRDEIARCYESSPKTKIGQSLRRTVETFSIPRQYLEALITGMELDLQKTRYETFDELEKYCYLVASIVGLICIEIFGYKHASAKEYAINLGKALQLVNIIRDVKEDASYNRIYLPAEDLRRFRYSENELFESVYNTCFIELMSFQAERALGYFKAARQALHAEDRPNMLAAEAMAEIYLSILQNIKRAQYNVFSNSFKPGKLKKASLALKVWVRSLLRG
ncbi:MAG: presqualene diphosphate synthase HpnD [Acidobacteriota bacterium]|nr:presqualene diphosphate synthase HpnD [Blastocatellia bacterium]MDW8411801.1 presqualene diphosphate synthase HpnD [Acidobacteriota bacterium]